MKSTLYHNNNRTMVTKVNASREVQSPALRYGDCRCFPGTARAGVRGVPIPQGDAARSAGGAPLRVCFAKELCPLPVFCEAPCGSPKMGEGEGSVRLHQEAIHSDHDTPFARQSRTSALWGGRIEVLAPKADVDAEYFG
jgi:hypothetical protein